MMEGKTPKIRFRGFSEPWKTKKLGDICTKIGSGKTPRGGDSVYTKEGIPFIRSQNVLDSRLFLDGVCITLETHEEMSGSKVLAHDVLLNITGGSIGRSCVVPESFLEGNVNQHVCIVRTKKDSPFFLQAHLASHRGQKLIFQGQTGSGREGLNFETIRGFKINFPSLPEQQKIASFLSAVDERIELLERKKEKLEAYKKGVMQQIFSPQIRFKQDDGSKFPDWEEKRLGEVCEKQSSSITAGSLEETGGEFKIYGATGFLQFVDFYMVEQPFISIVKDGAGVGRVLRCDPKSSVLGTLDILLPKKNVSIDFLFATLSRISLTKYVTGSTIPHIYFKDYSKEKVAIPSLPEQKKIAAFLNTIDRNLETLDSQIQGLRTWKKGLLQQMFV